MNAIIIIIILWILAKSQWRVTDCPFCVRVRSDELWRQNPDLEDIAADLVCVRRTMVLLLVLHILW